MPRSGNSNMLMMHVEALRFCSASTPKIMLKGMKKHKIKISSILLMMYVLFDIINLSKVWLLLEAERHLKDLLCHSLSKWVTIICLVIRTWVVDTLGSVYIVLLWLMHLPLMCVTSYYLLSELAEHSRQHKVIFLLDRLDQHNMIWASSKIDL